jgi:hypothetical protein
MALNFGKGNRSIAFNPTAAFPLDARCYFESLEEAEEAARSAEDAGSTNTIYYFGQTIAVFENNISKLYIIQKNNEGKGTLLEIATNSYVTEKINKLADETADAVLSNFVKYSEPQELNTDQKTQARNNIGAVSQDDVDDRINQIISDASNTESIKNLTSLVDYLDTHGAEAAEMATAIDSLETEVETIKTDIDGIKLLDTSITLSETI